MTNVELRHAAVKDFFIGESDLERLLEVSEKERAKVLILVGVPLFEVRLDKKTAAITRRISNHGCELIRRAEYPLHSFEIFEPDSFDDVRVIFELTEVGVAIPVECIDAQPSFLSFVEFGDGTAFHGTLEATPYVITTQSSRLMRLDDLRYHR